MANSGTAFNVDAFNRYAYNDRSELTSSNRYQGTDVNDLSVPVDPEKRIYGYDPIGNRNNTTEGTESKSYASNSLNQYDEITAGGSPLSLTYDADGNLTAHNGIDYTYNAENRLIKVEPAAPADGDTKIECIYDYQGRRIKKAVYSYSAGFWQLNEEKLFVYDGWNLIEEITVEGAIQTSRYFVWGLDLSQSLQGAGGIGGLLATVDGADTYYFAYDGNGNVGQVIDASTSTIAASYQYDPFGNTIKADGAYADENPFRFSTKYHDAETGLVYFGFRYYEPEMGRWISRDPIEEKDSLNLYLFVNNNILNSFDSLGLYTLGGAIRLEYQSKNPFNLPKTDNWIDQHNAATGYSLHYEKGYNEYKSKLTAQEVFDIWFKWEEKRGSWWKSCLEPCPYQLCKVNGKFVKPFIDGDKWKDPERPKPQERDLHPDAKWSMRSKAVNGHTNQCTYKENGRLLTDYPSAGTVDWVSPGITTKLEHYKHDVQPIYLADFLDWKGKKMTFWRNIVFYPWNGQIHKRPRQNMLNYFKVRPLHDGIDR